MLIVQRAGGSTESRRDCGSFCAASMSMNWPRVNSSTILLSPVAPNMLGIHGCLSRADQWRQGRTEPDALQGPAIHLLEHQRQGVKRGEAIHKLTPRTLVLFWNVVAAVDGAGSRGSDAADSASGWLLALSAHFGATTRTAMGTRIVREREAEIKYITVNNP